MKKHYLLLALASALLTSPVLAQPADLTFTFTVSSATPSPGSVVAIWLNVLNPSSHEVSWTFPQQIDGRIVSSQSTIGSSLALRSTESATVSILPGTFARREYQLPMPASLAGQTVLEFPKLNANRVVLNMEVPSPVAAEVNPGSGSVFNKMFTDAEPEGPDKTFRPGRFFKEHFSPYDPFYFIAGTKSPNAKFQISFKYQLLNNDGPLAQRVPAFKGFHIAYTQTSLWNLNGPSPAFFDTSYKPEFMYVWERVVGGSPGDRFRLDLQGGLQHESNGRGFAEERSQNIAYLRPTMVFGKDDDLQLTVQPRAWVYLAGLPHNPDLADYRGYVDLRTIVGWRRGLQLSALGRLGKDGTHESLQLDLTYPTMKFFGSFSLYLNVQYFTGYGETLIGYNKRSDALRVGFSLFR